MANADENAPIEDSPREDTSAEDASADDAQRKDASETLPATPGGSVPAGGQPKNQDGVPVDDSFVEEAFAEEAFAEDVSGAKDFSEKALSERTRKAYRRAWSDFTGYCEGIGKDPLPARPVTVAAYINNRARGRPTDRGATEERSGEGLTASTLEQRLAAIKYYHESEGRASPTDHPQVSRVMQGI